MSHKTVAQALLKQAIIATDNFLGMYKDGLKRGKVTSQDVHDFTQQVSVAMEALKKFEVAQDHSIYIEDTIAKMAQLFKDEDVSLFDEPYAHTPSSSGEAESFEPEGNELSEKKMMTKGKDPCWKPNFRMYGTKMKDGKEVPNCVPVKEDKMSAEGSHPEPDENDIEGLENELKWEHIADTYKDEDFEKEEHVKEEVLDEKISASSRLRRRMTFSRTSPKRQMAAAMKLKRPSTQAQLQNRAKVAARRLLLKKLLRGRSKEQLSAQEKDMIEGRLKQMQKIQAILAQRLIPKIKDLERKRLKFKSK